jgi:hypothetical protein
MDGQVEVLDPLPNPQVGGWQSFTLGWPAYVRPLFAAFMHVFLLSIIPAAIAAAMDKPQWQAPIIVIGVLINIALFAYDVLYIRSIVFFTDDNGVWVAKGILPWNKGISGVKWRDVSEAVFFQSFASWALKTYTVRVGHKFTNDTELVVANVRNGHEAAQHVNQVLMQPQLFFARDTRWFARHEGRA